MNAPTPIALLAQPADTAIVDVDAILSGSVALAADERAKLEITEILDAVAKDAEGKAITTIAPLKYDLTDEMLAVLKQTFGGAQFDVKTPEGMKAAKETVSKLTKLKTSMEEAYTEWNKPIQELTKNARKQRDHAVDEVIALRDPIKAQIDVQQAELDRIKNEKAVAESRRIETQNGELTKLEKLHESFVSASVADIEAQIRELDSFEYLTRRDWEEFMPRAQDAVRANIEALRTHLTNAKAREELDAIKAKMQQEETERKAREQAAEDERNRVSALKDRISNIEKAPTTCIGLDSAQIQRTLDRVNAVDVATFAEFSQDAQAAIESARNNLQTMLDAAVDAETKAEQARKDAAELQAFRDAAAQAAREKQEAADAAARAEQEAAAKKERDAREEAERIEREKQEAARAARERAEAVAEVLLGLLIEAAPSVADVGLRTRIDAAIASAKGE